ncbi:MAG: Smg family protein [Halothiobacillus sp.]
MKETVLDLLMYLFENHMEEEPHLPPEPLRMDLQQKLLAAGYESDEISRAFSWLDGASESPSLALANVVANTPKPSSFRIYTDEEQAVLDLDAQGFLLQLEEIGVLSSNTRETVIERALALDHDDMDLDDIKWVVMLVLFARPGEEAAFAWMEELVFAEPTDLLH